jgi:hypothetical protein
MWPQHVTAARRKQRHATAARQKQQHVTNMASQTSEPIHAPRARRRVHEPATDEFDASNAVFFECDPYQSAP